VFVHSSKLHNSTAFIWSLYVLWAAINAYFSDEPPSERFQHIYDFVTPPKQVTVGVYQLMCITCDRDNIFVAA